MWVGWLLNNQSVSLTSPAPCSMFRQHSLYTLLKQVQGPTEKFWFVKSYQDVPDPELGIEGFGPVLLPIDDDNAHALYQHAPVGSPHYQSRNYATPDFQMLKEWQWQNWLHGVLGEVCTEMSLNAKKVTLHLDRLSLYGPEGRLETHRNAEDATIIGTLSVVLPGEVRGTGGSINLTHKYEETSIDFSNDIPSDTIVIAR